MKCLITKLTGSVQNDSLMKIGEMRINVCKVDTPTATTQKLTLSFNKNVTISIVGNGYFTDSDLSQNKGKNMSFTENEQKDVYVSNGDFEISITDKYSLTYARIASCMYISDIGDLKYSKDLKRLYTSRKTGGDLSALKDKFSLITLYCNSSAMTGDLSSLSNCTKLENLLCNNTAITGDLSSLKEMSSLMELICQETEIKGDLSSLTKMSNLLTLHCSTDVSGSIDSLQSNSLKQIWAGICTGDLAKISSKLRFISCSSSSSFTWSSRDSSSIIFGIEGSPTVTNVDKMLQDLASCQLSSESRNNWENVITAKGTRTSASDAAVQTLQSKGYTVSITPT